jgi:hypothetical protein
MPVTLRPEDADVSATAAIRTQQWGDKSFWTDRITWYLRGEHSPQQALPERAALSLLMKVNWLNSLQDIRGFDSVAGVKQRRASADGSQRRLFSNVPL